ncbi:MAG TPA: AAA family ATPase [Longimicrobiales bacterium]|nr:AAA family ATPase [Longimicrobiales bacterium]
MRSPGRGGPKHRLELFGGPVLRDPNGAIVPLSPSQEALLTLVWGHGVRGVKRRRVISLLWEEDDGPRPRHRLRQLLHDVSVRTGFRPVAAEGDEALRPDPAALPSDLSEFAAALNAGELRRALAFEREGFASKLRRIPGEAFEDWMEAKRVAFRRDLRTAASIKWDATHGSGAWAEARDAAEVLYALDPSEASLRKIMEARAATGYVGAAEAAFADFSDQLEPDVELSTQTVELMERIRRMGASQGFRSAHRTELPPLVGRKIEMEAALQALERVSNDDFVCLIIQGESGVGKTRLFDEILREAHLRGFRCLEARPTELERHIPLNPLVDMVSHPDIARHVAALEDPWRAVVASLLPTLPEGMDPPVVPYISETSLPRRLYDAFSLLFTNIAADQPTLLFIDDLQWADETTISVLQFAQRRWRKGRLGIVATVRTDMASRSEGLAGYLDDSRDLPTTKIEVTDLTEPEAIRLVGLVAQGSLDRATCVQLCALGGRNPFYLIELTKDYLAGRVTLPQVPGDALLIPISLRQLVGPRLEGLSQGAASAAAHLAVWGRWAPVSGLATLLAVPLEECTGYVEELEQNRLVSVERGSARIAHQLFRGAIYHGLSNARRALLHRTIAEYLTTTAHPLPGELAVHFAQSGEAPPAARHGRTAADQAIDNGAVAEAAYFLQLVIDNERDDRLKAEATGDLARVLHLNREIHRANPLLELAATRLRVVGNHARALRMDVRRVEGLAELGAAPMSELLDRLGSIKAAARAVRDDEALAFALDQELHLLHRSGQVAEVRKLLHEIRGCLNSTNPTARCQANASLALNVLFGDGDEALKCGRAAVRIAEEEGLKEYALTAMNRLFLALLYRGLTKTAEAEELLAQATEGAKRSGDIVHRFTLRSNQGVAHMDAGELDEAGVAFGDAGAIITKADVSVLRANHYCNLGELAYQRHDLHSALVHFQDADDALGGTTTPADVAQLVNAGIGLCHLHLGALTKARQREASLQPLPEVWSFDPTLVLAFMTRLLERRGEIREAHSFIRMQRGLLEERLPPAWLLTLPLEARLARKTGGDWRVVVLRGIAVADSIGYSVRSAELRAWL